MKPVLILFTVCFFIQCNNSKKENIEPDSIEIYSEKADTKTSQSQLPGSTTTNSGTAQPTAGTPERFDTGKHNSNQPHDGGTSNTGGTSGSNTGGIGGSNTISISDGSGTGPETATGPGTPAGTDNTGNITFSLDSKNKIIETLIIKEKDKSRVNKWVSELMKFTLSLVLFFYSLIMYFRSVRLLNEVRNLESNYSEHWIWSSTIVIGVLWFFFWQLEHQGLLLLLSSYCLVSSILPFLLASLNFTNSIYAIRKSEIDAPLLSSESLASLIFSLVAFTANIFKIIVFINDGK